MKRILLICSVVIGFIAFSAMQDNKAEFKSFLQSLGYDGVMYVEEIREDADITQADEFTRAVTIFEPNQVKLADGRNTEFSALNNDIRYEKGTQ